ncbi:Uncharacterised protein [Cytobacillus firmus]|nr:Uncharacterised protein [Cytobacillus firmus]
MELFLLIFGVIFAAIVIKALVGGSKSIIRTSSLSVFPN